MSSRREEVNMAEAEAGRQRVVGEEIQRSDLEDKSCTGSQVTSVMAE